MEYFRTVEVDLTNPACGYKLGILGEHNATQLVVLPPEELTNAAAFNVAFSVGGTVFQSEIAPTENGVYITRIGKEVTRAPLITFQLQAFDDDGNVIGRSALLRGSFEPGVPANGNPSADISDSILQNIAKNTAARHTHDNKSTLDKLGGQNNKVTFNGEPIGGGGGLPDITPEDAGKVLGVVIEGGTAEWGTAEKQNVINENNKLPYAYLSGAPTIPAPYDDTEIKQRVNALETALIGVGTALDGLDGSLGIGGGTDA